MSDNDKISSGKGSARSGKNPLFTMLLVVLIFAAGWSVGGGKLQLGNLKSQNSQLASNLDYSTVEKVYDTLKADFDGELDTQKLLDGVKTGLAKASGDPYTEYMPAEEAKAFGEQLDGTFSGIGAELGKATDNKTVIIVAPIAGFPAEKAGLRPKDAIVQINDQNAYDMTLSEAVAKIRGPVGSKVKLKIVRDGQPLDFEIARDTITIPSVTTKTLDGGILQIIVSRYGKDTTELVQQAAKQAKQSGVKGVILDLRGNPGGELDAAVGVSSIWLKNKTVLREKRGSTVIKTYQSTGDPILEGMPTVVLINEGSASASEITAGALRDNQAATLMGVKSFGKGSVQEVNKLPGGGILKVTIARWYTPNDKNIDKSGLEPDQKVERTDEDIKNQRDPQLEAAAAKLR